MKNVSDHVFMKYSIGESCGTDGFTREEVISNDDDYSEINLISFRESFLKLQSNYIKISKSHQAKSFKK